METNERQLDLARQIAWLKDYVILDRKDYEKLVYNSKRTDNEIYKELLDEQKEVNKQIKAYNEILKQHNNYLMSFYNISRGL